MHFTPKASPRRLQAFSVDVRGRTLSHVKRQVDQILGQRFVWHAAYLDEKELEEIAEQIDLLSRYSNSNLTETEVQEVDLELNRLQKRYFEISGEDYNSSKTILSDQDCTSPNPSESPARPVET